MPVDAMFEEAFASVVGTNPVWQGLAGGVVIAFLNMLGALLIFVWRRPSERAMNGALGMAAGVMLAASFTSLILPGIQYGGIIPVLVGMLLGAFSLDQADRWVPHMHVLLTGRVRGHDEDGTRLASILLFIVAITLHNMPEGLAVGVAFGSGNLSDALTLMLAIGIQNIPEGLAVSIAAINTGLDRRFYAVWAGVRAGIVEIPLAVIGAWAVTLAAPIMPYAMGFAAGAMLYVISDEVIPETHGRGHERMATWGTIIGVIVMLYLDIALAG